MRFAKPLRRTATAGLAVALIGGAAGPVVAGHARTIHRQPVGVAPPPPGTQRPTREVLLSVGEGQLITLPAAATSVWVSSPEVADVYISNSRQLHLFGKGFGEATVFATGAGGAVIYSASVRVSQNITSVDRMLAAAMPDAHVNVVNAGQVVVLTGTVASPEDAATARQLVTAYLNPGVDATAAGAVLKIGVVSRLKTATPLQVNLQVRIAEVSRSFVKNLGVNLQTFDGTGGFRGGLALGRGASSQYTVPGAPLFTGGTAASVGTTLLNQLGNATTIGLAGHLLGLDLLGSLDAGETDGQVTTLANPNLTALSGETATFLAGGEIPIPVSQGLGAVSVEYKQYGVSLSYTPTVLADGRISLRVRPEVSQLSSAGAVTISGTTIPALVTRRAETTVEMGSGQSYVIAGLLSNNHNDTIQRTPGAGDIPVLGALFRSNAFQRNETELVIVVTPYLVKPVNSNEVHLPTDGYQAPTDLGRVLMGQLSGNQSGGERPRPTMAPSGGAQAQPAIGAAALAPPVDPGPRPAPAQQVIAPPATASAGVKRPPVAAPGFSSN